jgi:hypothetical protein
MEDVSIDSNKLIPRRKSYKNVHERIFNYFIENYFKNKYRDNVEKR